MQLQQGLWLLENALFNIFTKSSEDLLALGDAAFDFIDELVSGGSYDDLDT